MEVWELVARESIRDLVSRYNANGDSGRFAEVVRLFAPDGVIELDHGPPVRGRVQINDLFTSVRADIGGRQEARYLRHLTATHQIDVVDQAQARGRCYYVVLMAHGLDHWGRYIDDYRCVDGTWLFARRRVTTDGAAPGGWAASRAVDPTRTTSTDGDQKGEPS
jgi:hypothetical protein